ncbi:MAG: GntR family transcriptional regulator [Firmicutes bacterium]|nr:GntR family transcriptional regulator [Bacillota bacterium]
MLNFDLQNHRPLREIVYEELKRQILVGEIAPGTRMMEVELADVMGVSRTPVREAIRKLEKEGLVTIEPRKGAYASNISIKDMVDVLEVRQGLEGMAAAIASGRITQQQKEELLSIVDKYKAAVEAANIEEIIKYDEAFHSQIISISGNKTLMQVFSIVQELALRFRYIYYDDFNRYESMPREHQLIEEAIMSGNADKARVAAGDHVSKLKEFILNEGEKAFGGQQ